MTARLGESAARRVHRDHTYETFSLSFRERCRDRETGFRKGKGDSATLLVSIPGAVLTWIISITVIFRLGWSM